MKVGDLVKKTGGVVNRGETGVVLKLCKKPNRYGFLIADVLTMGNIKTWAARCLEVIK